MINSLDNYLRNIRDYQSREKNPKAKKWLSDLDELLMKLHQKGVFKEEAGDIYGQLNKMEHRIDRDPAKAGKYSSEAYAGILSIAESRYSLVNRGHYFRLWLALGMAVFGLPLGLVFFAALDNAAFLSIGLPFGLAMGIAIGSAKDKKAEKEGRVLE